MLWSTWRRPDAVTAAAAFEMRSAAFGELNAATLYAILQLRLDVFVLEQRCIYRELDGRDTEPTTRHVWLQDSAGAIVTYLRLLAESDGATRIGRVVTAPAYRGRGLADRLLSAVLADVAGPVVADAQTHLQAFYERHGFTVTGPAFVDAGIAHVPLRRPPSGAEQT
jgi:ElaA protein